MNLNGTKIVSLMVVLGFSAQAAHALHTTPGVIEAGDTISFTVPVRNVPSNTVPLTNVRLVVLSAPSWIQQLNTSVVGPVRLPPGQGMHFRLDFQIGSTYTPGRGQGEITVQVVTDTTNLDAAKFVWHFRTSNGFLTSSAECLDEQGHSFGGALTPDFTPPVTTLFFVGPAFTDTSGNLFLSTQTALGIQGVDQIIEDAVTSDAAFTGFAVDRSVTNINQLAPFISTFTLSPGGHFIVFASSDNAGNAEALRTQSLFVDGTPPVSSLVIGSPQATLADGSLLVSSRTPFVIASTDPVSNGAASGVKDSFLSVNGSPFSVVSGTFTLSPPDGPQIIRFFSRDNVLNTEVAKSTTVVLDSTPPSAVLLSPSPDAGGVCRVFNGKIPVLGTVADLHFSGFRLEFAPGAGAVSGFTLISSGTVAIASGTLGLWDTTALSGFQTLRLTAADLVQNVAVVRVNVFVGDPSLLLTLGGKKAFNKPEGVAVGTTGNIYVADTNNDRIQVFSSTGGFLDSFGRKDGEHDDGSNNDALKFNKPKDVKVDAAGNVFVADTNDNRIVKLSPTGRVLFVLGRIQEHDGSALDAQSFKEARFNKPHGAALDGQGNIYVADTNNHRVQVFGPDGALLLTFNLPPLPPGVREQDEDEPEDSGETRLGRPFGIAVDGAKNIYVADGEGDRALQFSPTGNLLLAIGASGKAPGQFMEPQGVAVAPDGNCLYVSDRNNNRVQRFDFQGNVTLVFGKGGESRQEEGRREGDDNAALPAGIVFNKPVGLALDASGNLYVADRNNNRIQKFGSSAPAAPIVISTPSQVSAAPPSVIATSGTVIGPSAAPGLRSALAFPNPAVRTDPTIRAFLGIVNSVEVTIFDSAGHVVHSGSVSGAPTGISNGQYYYDYKWTGGKASGVYFAAIHGKAADGEIVRARVQFAVVR